MLQLTATLCIYLEQATHANIFSPLTTSTQPRNEKSEKRREKKKDMPCSIRPHTPCIISGLGVVPAEAALATRIENLEQL